MAGAVCDFCRRQILDYNVVPSATNAGTQKDFVVIKLIIGQSGGCDTAFDNNEQTVSESSLLAFTETCGDFIPFFVASGPQTCCCTTCIDDDERRTSVPGGISRRAFGDWLGRSLEAQVLTVLELNHPSENAPECDPEMAAVTSQSFHLSLDYVLDPAHYDLFFSQFVFTYNQMCLENCYPQRLESIIPLQEGGMERRRLQGKGEGKIDKKSTKKQKAKNATKKKKKEDMEGSQKKEVPIPVEIDSLVSPCAGSHSCIEVKIFKKCFSGICSQGTDACGLFGDCKTDRKLEELQGPHPTHLLKSLGWETTTRHLQDPNGTTENDACLCPIGDDAPGPTFELPSKNEFLNIFNVEIAQVLGVGGIDAILGQGIVGTAGPATAAEGEVSPASDKGGKPPKKAKKAKQDDDKGGNDKSGREDNKNSMKKDNDSRGGMGTRKQMMGKM